MKNLKEKNIQRALWHIKRHCNIIENNSNNLDRNSELFYLKESIEVLMRIFNDEKPYPNLDIDDVF